MKTILLARHGQASFGKDNYDELSDLGVQQAKLLGEYFAKHQRKVEQIFAGTMVRQQDSARHFIDRFVNANIADENIDGDTISHEIINNETINNVENFPIHTISQFNEFNHEQVLLTSAGFDNLSELRASLANTPHPNKQLAKMFMQAMMRWHSAEQLDNNTDYDESWLQFATRCQHGLQQVIEQTADGQTSLVFTSGGVISSIASTLFKPTTDSERSQLAFSINRQLANTSVTTIIVSDDNKNGLNIGGNTNTSNNCQLLTLNACEHLYLAGEEFLSWY